LEFHNINNLIVICGPTAAGKTLVSIEVAKAFDAEIISADSRQFFRELKIGVASPEQHVLKVVKHHFVGQLSVNAYYNVSRFENEVMEFLDEYFSIHKYALMVGGSGLYIDAVCKGIDILPDPDMNLRSQLKKIYETEGLETLIKQLKELDPEYYRLVDLNNPNRIMRALEVCISTGNPFSSLRSNVNKIRDFRVIKIGLDLPRAELFDRIERRVDQMIESGLVEEVTNLSQYRSLNSLNAVGYKEIFNYLDGNCSLAEAIEKIKINTRRYAKRQLTWFKKDNSINWFQPDEIGRIIDFIKGSN
jgi:tRNA dimethylallyltransferase